MEAFLYQQQYQSFLGLDPASSYYPSSPIDVSLIPAGEHSNASSSCFTSSEAMQETSTCSLDAAAAPNPQASSSPEKKRKQSAKESKSRRKKATNAAVKGESREEKEGKVKEMKAGKMKTASSEEPPTGYIHVRARRGQATDSHSLAERVRRERISERMKRLQGLVPGCDKVIGKALVLDEIINYVQSLQNQVEFLSMKLASLNPIYFGVGFEEYLSQAEEMGSISQPMPSVIQNSCHNPPTVFEGASSSIQEQVIDHAFPLHGHGPPSLSQIEDSYLLQVGGHSSNMCSFPQRKEAERASQTFYLQQPCDQ